MYPQETYLVHTASTNTRVSPGCNVQCRATELPEAAAPHSFRHLRHLQPKPQIRLVCSDSAIASCHLVHLGTDCKSAATRANLVKPNMGYHKAGNTSSYQHGCWCKPVSLIQGLPDAYLAIASAYVSRWKGTATSTPTTCSDQPGDSQEAKCQPRDKK